MTRNFTRPGLIVVDMQEDFCEPQGSLAIKGARELAPKINLLLAQPFFVLKLATQDFHPANHVSFTSRHPDAIAVAGSCVVHNPENAAETQITMLFPDHCVQGTPGADLIPEIDRSRVTRVIQKGWDSRVESFSGFGPAFRNPTLSMTPLADLLRHERITHLFIVGVGFDGCVKCTALDGVEFGYPTFVIEGCVNAVARSPEKRVGTLEDLKNGGVSLVKLDLATDTPKRDLTSELNALL